MLGLGSEKDNKGPPKHKNIYRIYVMYKLPALGIYYKLLVLVKKWTKVIDLYCQFLHTQLKKGQVPLIQLLPKGRHTVSLRDHIQLI